MKINEIFSSIQGEGKYQGYPVLFIRLSGCTRKCFFCDTKYHTEGKEMSVKDLVKRIGESKLDIVVFTGGEPLLQFDELIAVMDMCHKIDSTTQFHLETNGDLIGKSFIDEMDYFDYVAVSPKDEEAAKKCRITPFLPAREYISPYDNVDIKIVTDLDKLNKNLIPYATMLMPLTTYNIKEDDKIRKRVWEYCVKHNLKYSMRMHTIVYGKKRMV